MKIAIVVSDPTSGLLQYPVDLALCFEAQGHEVVVLSWTTKGQNPDLHQRILASRIQFLVESSLAYSFGKQALLKGFFAKASNSFKRADLLLTFGPLSAWQARSYLKKGGVSLSMIAAMGHDRTSRWKPVLGAILLNSYTTHVGALCNLEIDRLTRLGVKPDKIVLVHNWIDLNRLAHQAKRLSDSTTDEFLHRLGLKGANKKFIACLASFQPRKRQDLLIKAYAALADQYTEYDLVLAGSGAEQAACEKLALELGVEHRVHFVGLLVNDDAVSLLVASDIVVHCSNAETFGYSMVEPLYLEKATLVTKVGIAWEMQNADVAEVVAPDNLSELTAGLEKLLRRGPEIQQRITKARQFVIDNFEVTKIAQQILQLSGTK
jgi:glycosyltransferase involved in cell wall biosynthesis